VYPVRESTCATPGNESVSRLLRIGREIMTARLGVSVWVIALIVAGCASSEQPVRVRIVNDESLVRGCRVIGTVADNELEDLQKKAARVGGNVALMTPQRSSKGGYFGLQDYMTADVYQCDAGR
jgi:hypothetical protein